MESTFKFGQNKSLIIFQHTCKNSQIFFRSKLSFGIVNLKPVVTGHVLVLPKRCVKRVSELRPEEASDLFLSAQQISNVIQREFDATSLTFAIQDGKDAGQTVEHVHIHVLPRKKADFKENDQVYSELEIERERMPRSEEEMSQEAEWLSSFFDTGED